MMGGVSPDEALDFWFWDPVWDYDGERLAFVTPLGNARESWVRIGCGFCLGVYEEPGLAYYGEYRSSLDTGAETNSSYYCRVRDYDPLTVRWQT